MNRAVYAGRFDPITQGHYDIIQRSSELFDEVIILVSPSYGYTPFFSESDRVGLVEKVAQEFDNVRVDIYNGLVVDYARQSEANLLIRGIHAVINFEHEMQQASTNMALNKEIETVFILSRPTHAYISSSVIVELGKNKGDFSRFVPKCIVEDLNRLFTNIDEKEE